MNRLAGLIVPWLSWFLLQRRMFLFQHRERCPAMPGRGCHCKNKRINKMMNVLGCVGSGVVCAFAWHSYEKRKNPRVYAFIVGMLLTFVWRFTWFGDMWNNTRHRTKPLSWAKVFINTAIMKNHSWKIQQKCPKPCKSCVDWFVLTANTLHRAVVCHPFFQLITELLNDAALVFSITGAWLEMCVLYNIRNAT